MKQSAKSLAEHLKGFSAVSVDAVTAAAALEKSLLRYGPVQRDSFGTFQDALNYFLPIKSFTTRFLVLGLGKWTILVTDMRGENCYVDAYSISRATGCNAIGLHTRQERRELHVFENGQKLCQVQSLHDGDRWYYLERGALQPFEDVEECQRRKKKDRLGIEHCIAILPVTPANDAGLEAHSVSSDTRSGTFEGGIEDAAGKV